MARLSLVEASLKVAGIQALRRPGAVKRAARQRLHPASPSQVRYLQLMARYTREVERLVSSILLPALPPEPNVQDGAEQMRADSSKNLDDAFAELNAQLLGLADRMAPAIATVGRAVTKKANADVGKMLNIDLRGGEAALEPFVQSFIAENVKLVKSVGFDQLDKLRTIISEHTGAGGTVQPLRNKLMDSFGLTRSRATLIARDQILKAAGKTNELRQKQVGITGYTWSTSQDERVRPDHAKLDGETFDWSNPPVVDEKTGRRAHPGLDFSCRCVAIPNVAQLLGEPEGD